MPATNAANNAFPISIGDHFSRNLPQLKVVVPDILLFVSAGLSLADSLGWGIFSKSYYLISWFVGALAGNLGAIYLLKTEVAKKKILIGISILTLLSGVVYLVVIFFWPMLVIAQYLNGFASGVNTIVFVVTGSEIAPASFRGSFLSMQYIGIAIGLFIRILLFTLVVNWFYIIHGILNIIISIFALVTINYFQIEKLDELRKERQEVQVNFHHESIWIKLIPFIKMLFFYSLAMSFSNTVLIGLMFKLLSMAINSSNLDAILFAIMRLLGGILSFFTIDLVGRKISSLLSLLFVGVFLTVMATNLDPSTFCTLAILLQLAGGIYEPHMSVLISEAFPFSVKLYLLSFCQILLHIVQIIITLTAFNSAMNSLGSDYYLSTGIIAILLSFCFVIFIPETKRSSLSNAQDKMSSIFDSYLVHILNLDRK